MKKEKQRRTRLYRAFILMLYLAVLAYLSGFAPHKMFEWRGVAGVLFGTLIFSIPLAQNMQKKEEQWNLHVWNQIAENGVMSGFFTAILFLLAHLSKSQSDASAFVNEIVNFTRQLGTDLRPILYGLCIYTILHTPEEEWEDEPQDMQAAETPPQELATDVLYLFYQKAGLTNRETELAILAYRGYSNREIAEECYISEATVKKHMTHIFEKLGVTGREELRVYSDDHS